MPPWSCQFGAQPLLAKPQTAGGAAQPPAGPGSGAQLGRPDRRDPRVRGSQESALAAQRAAANRVEGLPPLSCHCEGSSTEVLTQLPPPCCISSCHQPQRASNHCINVMSTLTCWSVCPTVRGATGCGGGRPAGRPPCLVGGHDGSRSGDSRGGHARQRGATARWAAGRDQAEWAGAEPV